jgi:aspartyl-tRNA(Asn)/glutamyl-tRNA(Gln) amidotransferase subunit B
MGYPGVLPVINALAVDDTIMTALALNCSIPEFSKFDRKNYFYPDLPKGYQISQYDIPLSRDGYLTVRYLDQDRRIGIHRVHLEEDTGRHLDRGEASSERYSLIDLNRAGVPLMEIVSEPDMSAPEEARLYMEKLRTILVYLGVNSGKMEDGALRCDANVSVRPHGQTELGVKTEIKNMNSFRAVERALAFEAQRQINALRAGEVIHQETRGWIEERGITVSQRTKEFAHDYRYFPEPDLPPLTISREWVERVRARLPELPDAKRQRFEREYDLSTQDAEALTAERPLATYYEAVVTATTSGELRARAKTAANWVLSELKGLLNSGGLDIAASPVSSGGLAELLDLIAQGEISGKQGKEVLEQVFINGQGSASPAAIVAREGISQLSDASELARAVDLVLAQNPKAVADYHAGKSNTLGFLIGQVMRLTKGRARPDVVNELVSGKLGASS